MNQQKKHFQIKYFCELNVQKSPQTAKCSKSKKKKI